MIAAALALALVVSAQAPASPPAAPAKEMKTPSKGALVLGKQMPASGKGQPFEISVGDCKVAKGAPKGTPPDCFLFVSLKGGKGKEKLQWTAKSGSIFQQGENNFAIGDEADTALAIAWKPVSVAKGIDGVIVSLQSGGDRLKHRHDVFLNVKGRLNYALTASEPRGPLTWSNITPLDMDNNGFPELLLMHAARPDEEEADRWNLDVYGWRADIQKMVKLPSWAPTIHGAVVGSYNNVKEAREEHAGKCLREFMVLDHKSLPLMQEGTYNIVYPAATPGDAELALEAAKACDEDIVGAVKVLMRGLDVEEK
jgi:hypothetical protein